MNAANEQRSLAMLVLEIYLNSTANEELHNHVSAISAGQMERCRQRLIDDVGLRASPLNQQHQNLDSANRSSSVKHSLAKRVV